MYITRLSKYWCLTIRHFQAVNEDMKSEISVLRQQLEHNPVVTQYAKENQNLRKEIKRLQTREHVASALQYNDTRCRQLEAQYAELLAQSTGEVKLYS